MRADSEYVKSLWCDMNFMCTIDTIGTFNSRTSHTLPQTNVIQSRVRNMIVKINKYFPFYKMPSTATKLQLLITDKISLSLAKIINAKNSQKLFSCSPLSLKLDIHNERIKYFATENGLFACAKSGISQAKSFSFFVSSAMESSKMWQINFYIYA